MMLVHVNRSLEDRLFAPTFFNTGHTILNTKDGCYRLAWYRNDWVVSVVDRGMWRELLRTNNERAARMLFSIYTEPHKWPQPKPKVHVNPLRRVA